MHREYIYNLHFCLLSMESEDETESHSRVHPCVGLSFLHICTQTADLIELKFGEWTGWLWVWLIFSQLPWIPTVSWPLNNQAVSAHLQTNHWLKGVPVWWTNSWWASPVLIIFWLYSAEFPLLPSIWLVKQFPPICRQTAHHIQLKLGGVNTLWDSAALVNFWLWLLNPHPFSDLWLVKQFPYICRQTTDLID